MLPAPPDLRRAPDLKTSRRTLFVFEPDRDEWWISTWRGDEVRLPVADLEEFFEHCRRHSPGPGGVDPTSAT